MPLYNTRDTQPGQFWQPAYWYAPDGSVVINTSSWVLNPFNPATPISNVYISNNNILSLQLQPTPSAFVQACGSQAYVSGTIQSAPTFRQLYGYFEANIAVSALQGVYYTFTLQTDLQNPPQIDVANVVSLEGTNSWFTQAGVWDASTNSLLPQNTWQSSSNVTFRNYDVTQFHTYGVDWQPSGTTFYLDRTAVFQVPSLVGYTSAMFPVLTVNSGVPGVWSGAIINPTLLPAIMQIASINVWQFKPF
jgi:serralysin